MGRNVEEGKNMAVSDVTLKRNLTYGHGFVMAVGMIMGTGLFFSPGLIAKHVPNMFVAQIMWVICGMGATFAGAVYCELGGLIPKSGSTYNYVLTTLGPLPAFLMVWTHVLIILPSGTAVLLQITGSYIYQPLQQNDGTHWQIKIIGFVVYSVFTVINMFGVKSTFNTQYIFAASQVMGVLSIISMGIWWLFKTGDFSNFYSSTIFPDGTVGLSQWDSKDMAIALSSTLFALDGWWGVTYLTEELKNAERNLPLVTFTAIPFAALSYLVVNLSYMAVLTQQEMGKSVSVGITLAEKVGGEHLKYIMILIASMNCLGSINAGVFGCSRFCFSAAREGQLPRLFSSLHPKYHTPIPVLLMNAILVAAWLFSGVNLEGLLECFNSFGWMFCGLAFLCCLILKHRWKDSYRIYSTFHVTPAILMCISFVIVMLSVISSPLESSIAILFMLAGIPLYYILGISKK